MLHELILVCLSIGVVTTTLPRLSLASGSTSCVTTPFCKAAEGNTDGFACKESGGNEDVQTTVCEALNVHYNHWSTQAVLFDHLYKDVAKILIAAQAGQEGSEVVQGAIREINLRLQGGQNATSQLLAELDTLRGRQAVSAAVQVGQVLMFIGYLLTISIVYMVKHCQKARERKQNQEFELIEQKLQARKAKRRAAAASAKSAPGPSQE